MKKIKFRIENRIKQFNIILKSSGEDHISEYSAQCSYYTILSFIPFLILLITLIQYTNIEQQTLFDVISKIIPSSMNEFVIGIVREVYSKSIGTISISIIFNSDAYESVKQGLETRRKLNKIDEQIGLSKKKIVTLDFKQKQIENERNINIENWKKVALEKSKLKQYSEKLIERRNALEEELKKIEREQDELSKKKIELDSSIKQYEEIEKIKSDEQDKNLADKQKEEENIQIKEAEKRRLQDILNN